MARRHGSCPCSELSEVFTPGWGDTGFPSFLGAFERFSSGSPSPLLTSASFRFFFPRVGEYWVPVLARSLWRVFLGVPLPPPHSCFFQGFFPDLSSLGFDRRITVTRPSPLRVFSSKIKQRMHSLSLVLRQADLVTLS